MHPSFVGPFYVVSICLQRLCHDPALPVTVLTWRAAEDRSRHEGCNGDRKMSVTDGWQPCTADNQRRWRSRTQTTSRLGVCWLAEFVGDVRRCYPLPTLMLRRASLHCISKKRANFGKLLFPQSRTNFEIFLVNSITTL